MKLPLQHLITACSALCGLFGLYFAFTCAAGLLRRRTERPERAPATRIAAIAAARDEERVVGRLVASLLAQDYPRALFDVYIVPNNCTDGTEAAAIAAGARILRCDGPVRTKGDALRAAFAQLAATGDYDAYCVFDADNLADPGFFRAVNDARLSGLDAAQGFRDSKNPRDSWTAGAMSAFYWFMSRFYNESRARLGMSCQLNGTGFMVSDALIRRIGWDTHTLTEDLEFTALCALEGRRIGWMPRARVYDEQPVRFWDSVVQRRRWTAGSLQCMRRYVGRLLRRRSVASVDMALLFMGNLLGLLGLVPGVAAAVDLIRRCRAQPALVPWLVLAGALYYALCAAAALLLYRMEGRLSRRSLPGILGFPLFLISWMPINLYACLTPPPRWKVIRHTRDYAQPDRS